MGIVLQLNTTKPPLLCIVSTSANITVLSAINVYAEHYNGTSVLAFVLGMVRRVCLCGVYVMYLCFCARVCVMYLCFVRVCVCDVSMLCVLCVCMYSVPRHFLKLALQRTVAVLKPALRSDGSRPVVYADMASFE